ncbi:MAG: hypothetical protein N3B21_15390 [Clostridia bacterium]|nr:hypothetical protein [Clostridia bacterium]
MEPYRIERYDKIILHTLGLMFLVDIIVLILAMIKANTIIYFLGEVAFMTVWPMIVIYSFVIMAINRFDISNRPLGIAVRAVGIIVYFCFVLLMSSYYYKMYSDIPNIVKSNYCTIKGNPNKVSIEGGRIRTWNFEINGVGFDIETFLYKDKIIRSQSYKVRYLPNSKYIIEIIKE